jgi:exonuclease III
MNIKLGKIASLNADGLATPLKRAKVLKWIKKQCKGIIMIQEAHSTKHTVGCWKRFFAGQNYSLYFSHGTSGSRGVVTAIPQRLVNKVISHETDNEGRMVLVEIKINKITYVVMNIYNHCQDQESKQIEFLNYLESLITKHDSKKIIICGDFNIIQDPQLDKWMAKPHEKPSKPAERLKEIITQHNMVDIWRLQNPGLKQYTWRRRKRDIIQQSRLDYVLVSDSLSAKTASATINPGFCSDHSLVLAEFNPGGAPLRGRGYWKFNNRLLEDSKYVESVKNKFQNGVYFHEFGEDDTLNWDTLKMMMRRDSITYSIHRSKERNKQSKETSEALKKAEEALNNSDGSNKDLEENYYRLKNEWQSIENEKTAGLMLRSRARYIEQGERNTKYFIGLEKHRAETKTITEVVTEEGTVSGSKEVLDELTKFYKNLYSESESLDLNMTSQFKSDVQISESDKEFMDRELTIKECKEALDEMSNNKSPGLDGFTVEFFKCFWNEIKDPFFKCINSIFSNEMMSIEQRGGIISLIPKGDKDPRFIKNWRPISLLNVDYKILTKVLANKLKLVLESIIHQDQAAYVKGRQIGHNIRIVQDLIDYCHILNKEGALLLVDFEKAFDSVSWSFLQHALKEFGFGESFCKWINIIYKNIYSSVQNNGHISSRFELGRGIRQGCPVSPYLFIICVELLAQHIRNNSNIEGIHINGVEFKILQFADDTALILKNKKSIIKSLETIVDFGKCSGLKLNISKTELFKLGNTSEFNVKDINLKWVPEFKYLGIFFSNVPVEMEYKNFRHRLDNMKNLLQIWLQRDLSLKGKVTILKTLAMSQLVYPLSMLKAPGWVVDEAESYFYKFLWNGKPDKVSRKTVIQNIEDGGIKMIDVDSMAMALKCVLVSKICDSENEDKKWCVIPKYFFYPITFEDFCTTRYTGDMLPPFLPEFYKQCLLSLMDLRSKPAESKTGLMTECLWYNKHIKQKGTSLMYDEWYRKGVKRVSDIVHDNGEFLTLEELVNKFKIKKSQFLLYATLKCCIPAAWKQILKSDKKDEDVVYEKDDWNIYVTMEGEVVNLDSCNTKQLYVAYTKKKALQNPKCFKFWKELIDIDKEDLTSYFYIPFKYIRDCKIQSLQYKILHNIYSNNLRKKQWRVRDDDHCVLCKEKDDMLHHFCLCANTAMFWNGLVNWFNNIVNGQYTWSYQDILLGYHDKCEHTLQINFLILHAKWYIFRSKYLKEKCFLLEYLAELKTRLKAEQIILYNRKENLKFVDLWQAIYDEL